MPELTEKLTAKMIGELKPTDDCDARFQIIRTFESGESEHFLKFRVVASSARPAEGFSTGERSVESFVYESILLVNELFLIQLPDGQLKLFKHQSIDHRIDSPKHSRVLLEEVTDFPESGHLVSIRGSELVIRHKSALGCFQSAPIEDSSGDAFRIVPDKKMLLWYLLGRVSSTELRMLANIYERNRYCV